MKSQSQRDHEAMEWLVKESVEQCRKAGNEGRFGEQDIRKHCEKIAEEAVKKREISQGRKIVRPA